MGGEFRRKIALAIALLSLGVSGFSIGASSPSVAEEASQAFQAGNYDRVEVLLSNIENSPTLRDLLIRALQNRGIQRFFATDIRGAVSDFDRVVALDPELAPYHWQRGICYYYAGEFVKGVEQFELHQEVNPNDVENAIWHFLCFARTPGGSVEKARSAMIPVVGDSRVPMEQIYDLFAGRGSEAAVLAAAKRKIDNGGEEALRNQLCYAHLYLGLYHEACGDRESSADHMQLAAETYSMDHYMGKTAQIHAKLRTDEKSIPRILSTKP